jgi:hypothetical protein
MIAIWTVLRSNDTLAGIDISNNLSRTYNLTQSIANDVMLHLSGAIAQNQTLKHLNLSKLGITDWCTLDYFAKSLSTCAVLESLDLSGYHQSKVAKAFDSSIHGVTGIKFREMVESLFVEHYLSILSYQR